LPKLQGLKKSIVAMTYLHFVVALPCEAKPLVDYFGLKRRMDHPAFPVYEKATTTLTVSGIGKTAAAAAVAYTQILFGNSKNSVWLNVGIAGYHLPAISQIFVAHKIVDRESGNRWYPPLLYQHACMSAEVATVARPETEYAQEILYDMEASGFYPTAQRFSTSELIQCLKIVSDHNLISRKQINSKQVSLLVKAKIETIENTTNQLMHMAQSLALSSPSLLAKFLQCWHFSNHQKLRLENHLRRWEVVSYNNPPDIEALRVFKTGKEILAWLENQLNAMPVVLEKPHRRKEPGQW